MTFKQLYANVKMYLNKCVKGETLVFTHRGFYGYKFEIKAVKDESKDKELEQLKLEEQFNSECG